MSDDAKSAEHGEPEAEAVPANTSFRVGRGIGLVSANTMALLEPSNGSLGEAMWALVGRGADVDDLLEALSATGLRSLGAFAMAQFEDDGVRVVVRGDAVAEMQVGSESLIVTAAGVRTWVEEVRNGVSAVVLRFGAPAENSLPFRLSEGIVPADLLMRGPSTQVDLLDADLTWLEDFDPDEVAVGASTTPASTIVFPSGTPGAAGEVFLDEPKDPNQTFAAREFEGRRATTTEPPQQVDPPQTPVALEPPAFQPVALSAEPMPPPVVPTAPDDYDFDEIFGRTVARSVQGAAVVPVSDEVPSDQSGEVVRPAPTAYSSGIEQSVLPPVSATISPMPPSSMIQGVPSSGLAGQVGSAQPPQGDHDGHTISKAQLQAMRAGQPSGPSGQQPSMGGPNVQAVVCASGHGNPPHLGVCRLCAAPLAGEPVLIARPSLGVLRFSGGQVVALDRPVLIGRNPKLEARMPSEMPFLLKLDVGQGLSRTHATIRLEGWQVLIEDLNSANGTVVTSPGMAPRRLHAGEPLLLEPGATIDFGGEVFATYGTE